MQGDLKMPKINMLSSADKIKGQGVMSAYIEQVNLVKNGLCNNFEVRVNKFQLCDIMHYHTIDPKFLLSIPFAKLRGTTVAYVHFVPETLEGSLKFPKLIREALYKYVIWFYKSVDHIVVVNPYFIDVLKKYNISEDKVTYIPNFVSEKNFYKYDNDKKNAIKKDFNIDPKSFVVLGVGQVQTRKGLFDFIEVAKKLPDIQFIWAGGFSFGAITDGYEELKKIVSNPPKNVKFIGIIERDKMNDIYNIADLLFLPSYKELFPMSVLEAMSLKLPILLRDLEIYKKIYFDSYLKGSNVEDFAKVIANIEKSHEAYETWCNNSWKCHNYYSESFVLNKWKEFYEKIYTDMENSKHRRKINAKQGI